ncbi:MAG TPA: peptide chain release factor 2 [Bacillota bacterium]|nr:peptide chain release factor 2 [Bacillota bacterium]HQB81788.1 peptide chain release factor 2 [Bacillota bacterium]
MTYEELQADIANNKTKIGQLRLSLRLEADAEEKERLTRETLEEGFWNDPDRAQVVQKRIAYLNKKQKRFADLVAGNEDFEVLLELSREEDDLSVLRELEDGLGDWSREYESLRLETLLTGEHDAMNALVSLHAGAGGTEAQDWVGILFRMYARWAENHDYEVEVLDLLDGEEAGIKTISFRVAGPNAYGYLRSEHGVHRLVRISPFDASGRRHTSFASCEVLPELDDTIKIEINPDDLKIDTFRASGAGGQHVNKTSSAVRITHLPTGIVVSCQNERSQLSNRETAMRMLKSRLYHLAQQRQLDRIEDLKGEVFDIAWGSQIRSYVFCPYTMVKDHRTGYETSDVDGVMDGDLDAFINAWLIENAQDRETAREKELRLHGQGGSGA